MDKEKKVGKFAYYFAWFIVLTQIPIVAVAIKGENLEIWRVVFSIIAVVAFTPDIIKYRKQNNH